jgi:hypothetical protein
MSTKVIYRLAAGIVFEFESVGDFAAGYRDQASKARDRATRTATKKEARFYEGQAVAFDQIAEVLESSEFTDVH